MYFGHISRETRSSYLLRTFEKRNGLPLVLMRTLRRARSIACRLASTGFLVICMPRSAPVSCVTKNPPWYLDDQGTSDQGY